MLLAADVERIKNPGTIILYKQSLADAVFIEWNKKYYDIRNDRNWTNEGNKATFGKTEENMMQENVSSEDGRNQWR